MRTPLLVVALALGTTTFSYTPAQACGMPSRAFRGQALVAQRLQKAQELLERGNTHKALTAAAAARRSSGATSLQRRVAARIAGLAALKMARFKEAERWLADAGTTRDVLDARAEALVALHRGNEARQLLEIYAAAGTLNARETATLAQLDGAPQGTLLARTP